MKKKIKLTTQMKCGRGSYINEKGSHNNSNLYKKKKNGNEKKVNNNNVIKI